MIDQNGRGKLKMYYDHDFITVQFAERLKEKFLKRYKMYQKAGRTEKAKSYYSCMQIVDNTLRHERIEEEQS